MKLFCTRVAAASLRPLRLTDASLLLQVRLYSFEVVSLQTRSLPIARQLRVCLRTASPQSKMIDIHHKFRLSVGPHLPIATKAVLQRFRFLQRLRRPLKSSAGNRPAPLPSCG